MVYKLNSKLYYNDFTGEVSNYPSLDYMDEKELNCDLFHIEGTQGYNRILLNLLVGAKGETVHIDTIARALNIPAKQAYKKKDELNDFFQGAFSVQPVLNDWGKGYSIAYIGPVDEVSGELLIVEPEEDEESSQELVEPSEQAQAVQTTSKQTPKKWFGLAVVVALIAVVVIALLIGQAKRNSAERQLEKDIARLQAFQKVEDKLLKSAEAGSAEAQYTLGLKYLNDAKKYFEMYGSKNEDAFALAVEWLEKAGEQNYVPAQAMLCLAVGDDWAERTADNNDAYGYYSLGRFYYDGQGGEYEFERAVYYFQMVANGVNADGIPMTDYVAEWNGYPTKALAQSMLGHYYEFSESHRDYAKALTYYNLAYNNGFKNAAYGIYRMYKVGKGVPRNEELAQEWHDKSGVDSIETGGGFRID